MAKTKNPRRVADNEAMAKLRMIRTSPIKLNLVAQMIRGLKVEKALSTKFSLPFISQVTFVPSFDEEKVQKTLDSVSYGFIRVIYCSIYLSFSTANVFILPSPKISPFQL